MPSHSVLNWRCRQFLVSDIQRLQLVVVGGWDSLFELACVVQETRFWLFVEVEFRKVTWELSFSERIVSIVGSTIWVL